jgi:hypothetical protein
MQRVAKKHLQVKTNEARIYKMKISVVGEVRKHLRWKKDKTKEKQLLTSDWGEFIGNELEERDSVYKKNRTYWTK